MSIIKTDHWNNFIAFSGFPGKSFIWNFGYLAVFRTVHWVGIPPPSSVTNAAQLFLTLKVTNWLHLLNYIRKHNIYICKGGDDFFLSKYCYNICKLFFFYANPKTRDFTDLSEPTNMIIFLCGGYSILSQGRRSIILA